MSDNDELRAIVREEVTAVVTPLISPLEQRVERVESVTKHLRDELAEVGTAVVEQAKTHTTLAKAVAETASTAGLALRTATEAKDDTAKMLTSAFEGHKQAVMATIKETMAAEIKPLAADVVLLKENDKKQDATLIAQNADLAAIKTETAAQTVILKRIGGWTSHWSFKLLFYVGVFVGVAAAAYGAIRGH